MPTEARIAGKPGSHLGPVTTTTAPCLKGGQGAGEPVARGVDVLAVHLREIGGFTRRRLAGAPETDRHTSRSGESGANAR